MTSQRDCHIRELQFRLYPLQFSFVARESIHFPPGKSANILRGAFGAIFRRIACVPHCPGARDCELRACCPYARMFEPAALGDGPSGLADWPRPFVFRATHLDGCTVEPGARFSFNLNLFDLRSPAAAYLVLAFAQLAREGLGPRRGRAELVEVAQLNETGKPVARIYDGSSLLQQGVEAMQLDLQPVRERVEHVRVRFVTPTELKGGPAGTCGAGPRPAKNNATSAMEQPEFAILASRIRDRISTLRDLYGDGPLEIDFRGFGERAAQVRLIHCDLHYINLMRRSSRSGQVHPIGGFIGEALYGGELAEFLPYLRAAKWTGVGRQTVWGKGEVEVGT